MVEVPLESARYLNPDAIKSSMFSIFVDTNDIHNDKLIKPVIQGNNQFFYLDFLSNAIIAESLSTKGG